MTDNLSVDIMHDLFEGVCVFDMIEIIKYFTTVVNFFTLNDLNFRLLSYDFGPIEGNNRPPIISLGRINKNSIKCQQQRYGLLYVILAYYAVTLYLKTILFDSFIFCYAK